LKAKAKSSAWKTHIDGATILVALSGDWVARTDGVELGVAAKFIKPSVRALKFDTAKLGHWDSALIAFLLNIRRAAGQADVALDYGGLPVPAQRLMRLASDPAAASPTKRPRLSAISF
jgi:phospholipid/cholesterol/gamma-HCH transport system permease protein